jgi:hypothetical protein
MQTLIRKFHEPLSMARGFTTGLLHDMGKIILIQSDLRSPIIQDEIEFKCDKGIIGKEKKNLWRVAY